MTGFCYNTLMSRQDPHTPLVPPANRYPLHSPEWVYDEIMRHIDGINDELTCPVCFGAEYITQERWEKRAAAHREIMAALWGTPAESTSLSHVPNPQPSGTATPAEPSPSNTQGSAGPLSEPKEGR